MTLSRRLALVCFVVLASSCASIRQAQMEQELTILRARGDQLKRMDDSLTQTPDPRANSHVAFFISLDAVNRVLALADGTVAKVPCNPAQGCKITDTYIFLDRVRLSNVDGFPALNVKAWAKRYSISVEVELDGHAEIVPNADPQLLDVSFAVDGIRPVIRTPFFTWRIRGLIRDLLETKVNTYAAAMPKLHIPIRREFPFSFPGVNMQNQTFPAGDGTVTGDFTSPPFSTTVAVKLDKFLLLEDGIHAYFVIE
jgi:hypothetical protein